MALLVFGIDKHIYYNFRFTSGYQPAILLTISLCVFPSEFPNFLRFWDKKSMYCHNNQLHNIITT